MLTPREHTTLLRAEHALILRVAALSALQDPRRASELKSVRRELERVSTRLDQH